MTIVLGFVLQYEVLERVGPLLIDWASTLVPRPSTN